jgi:amino acid transporter
MTRKTVAWLAVAFVVTLLVVVPALLMLAQTGVIEFAPDEAAFAPFLLGLAAFLGLLYVFLLIAIGIYVYRDARERGRLLWTLVVILVPYFIGFIAYLIVRQSRRVVCPSCGTRAVDSARFCPSCGDPLKASCPSCQLPVDGGARFCPACGAALTSAAAPPPATTR